MRRLAILSGQFQLPVQLAAAHPDALLVSFEGVPHAHQVPTEVHRFEALGALFEALREAGVTEVVMAGSMARPPLDPARFDPFMQAAAPRLLAAFQEGDDALLRLVISFFEEEGFAVRGAHELLPELTAAAGLLAGPTPDEGQLADAKKAQAILAALDAEDVGQGAVVAAGLCLGIETLQGTDALLGFVAQTPQTLRRAKGVFVKRPKAGQDLRVDMPVIGPATIEAAAGAGLAGLVIAAHQVMIVEREATLKAAQTAGLFLLAQDLS